MAIEVACSQCQGRLMVEQAGVIVACPHCGAHLTIEAPAEADAPQQNSGSTPSEEQPAASSPVDAGQQPSQTEPTVTAPANAPGDLGTATATSPPTGQSNDDVPGTAGQSTGLETPAAPTEIPGEQMPYLGNAPVPAAIDGVIANETLTDSAAAALPVTTDQAAPQTSPTDPAPAASEAQPASNQSPATGVGESFSVSSVAGGRGVSRHTFTLLRNYAIAITVAVVILVFRLLNPNTSALESLPDVKPPKKDDKIVYKLVPEATEMPPGHSLLLGQSQRFGNLKVTPVRVTHDPVEFVHHLGNKGSVRKPGPSILKLWFEFENVSADQSIAPLDGLVFKRDDNDWENVRSNNFVCRQSEKKKGGELVFVYDLNESDIWDLRGQNVELEIAPGEKRETYIPTSEEGIAQLMNSDEPLVWRVHFRKGYSRKNYGVTTVIEVAFNSSDIGAASTTPAETDGRST
jgi:hypothetical protein